MFSHTTFTVGRFVMKRSFTFVSLLLAAGLPAACSFNKATEGEITMDAGPVMVDVRLPNNGDGNNTFESDANVTCVATNPMTTNVPPDILILLDRSGSMNEDLTGMSCTGGCGAMSKWNITTAALAAYLPMVEGVVNLGLKLFASSSNGNVTVSPGKRSLTVRLWSGRRVARRIALPSPFATSYFNGASPSMTAANVPPVPGTSLGDHATLISPW